MKKVLISVLIVLFMLPVSVFAVSAELSPEREKTETGDVIPVEVDFREVNIGAVYATFSYDAELLEFLEGDGAAAAEGNGSIVLYASSASANRLQTVLKFRAKSMGEAEIRVNVQEALSFEEQPLEITSAVTKLRILRPTDSYVLVDVAGERMQALCTPPYFPEGFGETQIEIAGKSLKAATDGENIFVYLVMPDQETGGYYLRKDGEYFPAVSLQTEKILLTMPEKGIPEGFTPERFSVEGVSYDGYFNGSEYLVCAAYDGKETLYLYDPEEHTFQRYHTDVLQLTEYREIEEDFGITRPVILASVLFLLLIGILIARVRNRKSPM